MTACFSFLPYQDLKIIDQFHLALLGESMERAMNAPSEDDILDQQLIEEEAYRDSCVKAFAQELVASALMGDGHLLKTIFSDDRVEGLVFGSILVYELARYDIAAQPLLMEAAESPHNMVACLAITCLDRIGDCRMSDSVDQALEKLLDRPNLEDLVIEQALLVADNHPMRLGMTPALVALQEHPNRNIRELSESVNLKSSQSFSKLRRDILRDPLGENWDKIPWRKPPNNGQKED